MNRFFAFVGGAAALAGTGYVVYRFGLSETDRQAIRNTANSARGLVEQVRTMVEPMAAQTEHSSEAERVANREDTRRQWEELGY